MNSLLKRAAKWLPFFLHIYVLVSMYAKLYRSDNCIRIDGNHIITNLSY